MQAPGASAHRGLEESGLKLEEWKDVTYYEGAGCQECNETGFRGRTAIGELLARNG